MMSQDQDLKTILFISLTFFIAMILAIIPMSQALVWIRPEWVMMVLFFWVMMTPHRVAVVGAFFIGLLMDLLSGTLLGLHALLFSLSAFFILYFYVQIHGLPIWQRTLLFFAVLLAYFLLENWILSLTGVSVSFWQALVPACTSAILWPWVYLLLCDYQQHYEIY